MHREDGPESGTGAGTGGELFTNARIFQGNRGFREGSLLVKGGRIAKVILREPGGKGAMDKAAADKAAKSGLSGKDAGIRTTDLHGAYVIPGLVDIHTHGNSGCDFSDADPEGLPVMGRYLASHGITSFAPTSMTLPYGQLEEAFAAAAEYAGSRPEDCARLAGIHMEGPYLSEKKKGAQNGDFLRLPDAPGFYRLQEAAKGLIRIVDIAPELEGAVSFICEVSGSCRVSLAHTDASYEEAAAAFDAGAAHLTHLFNAMPPIHHREPGVIGAASERQSVTAELICDGFHIHPAVVRMAFKLFPGRLCLISDSMRCCGMPEGEYELGGQQVFVKDRQARLRDGTLAGAALNLYDDMVNAIRFGIPAEDAVLAATLLPAREVLIDKETGSLEEGKLADFLVCDGEWNLKRVYLGGYLLNSGNQALTHSGASGRAGAD